MLPKRIAMSVLGVLVCGFSVGIFKLAAFGVDPFQAFMSGMDHLIPIGFGTLYVIVNVVLLSFSLCFNRKKIGIATVINLLFLGYVTQFSYGLLQQMFPQPSIPIRAAALVIGVVIICFGSAFYMTADLGVSTYDAVAIIMADTWHLGKFQYLRIATDIVCVVLGVVLFLISGGDWHAITTFAGIGTIITAFFMGPLIEFFNVHVARPFLNEKSK
ncbi:MAG: hypothetical protein K6G04_00270 [Lachnospiraceae bacterium]|nr:hypothetical protein [Lachnospiraceae bacterium]